MKLIPTTGPKPFPWLLLGLGLLVTGAAMAWGWNWYQKRYPSWYEEVRLSDGRVITIHQKREYYENYGTAQSWVTIDLPELGGKRVWHSYLMPKRVDIFNGKVYVFGSPRGDKQYAYYKYPKHYLVGFMWDVNEFKRVPFLEIPEFIRKEENILPCISKELSITVTIAEKQRQWCEPSGDKGQFGKEISLEEYEALALRFSKRSGGLPLSE